MILHNTINSTAGAFFDTFKAVGALIMVFMNFKKTYVFKRPGEKTCRAEQLTKWSVVKEACQHDDGSDRKNIESELPVKEFKWVE